METKKVNYLMLVLTFVSALVGWFVAEYAVVGLMYSNQAHSIPNTVCVGIYFMILAVFGCLGVILSEVIRPAFNLRSHSTKSSFSKRILISVFAVAIAVVMLFSMGFQYLYELTMGTGSAKRDIVFVMDCSGSLEYGSMASGIEYPPTDKERQRIAAAKSIVEKLDEDQFCALVSFTDVPVLEFEPAAMSGDNRERLKQAVERLGSNGENNIKNALDYTYENIIKQRKMKNPAIILFTDGEDNSLNETNLSADIGNYVNDSIPIYSVEVNQRLDNEGYAKSPLGEVAGITDGQYIAKKSSDEIAGAFTTIYNTIQATANKNRVLIFKRNDPFGASQIWFFVVRVLFYIFVAALIGLAYTVLINSRKAIIKNILSGLIAGLIMEIGNAFGEVTFVLRLLTAVIILVVISYYTLSYELPEVEGSLGSGSFSNDFQGFGGMNDSNNEFR